MNAYLASLLSLMPLVRPAEDHRPRSPSVLLLSALSVLTGLLLLGSAAGANPGAVREGEIRLEGDLTLLTPYRTRSGEVVGGFVYLRVRRFVTASGRATEVSPTRERSARLTRDVEVVVRDRVMKLGEIADDELTELQASPGKPVHLLGRPPTDGQGFRLRRIVFPRPERKGEVPGPDK